MENKQNNNFQEFNQFQTYFYTNINLFNNYTNFEIKRNSVQLLVNISKGFPTLSQEILNIYSPEVKSIESPAIIRALQQAKFVNGFSRPKIPQFIYFKQSKTKAKPIKPEKKKITKKLSKKDKELMVDFDPAIIEKIQSILFLDNKDFEDFKYTEQVQNLGRNLTRQN